MHWIKRNVGLYRIYRSAVMWWKRKTYGLEGVHPTFFMAGHSVISRDFIAGEHSFIADGCRICPRVSIGRYVMFGPQVVITGSDHRFDVPGVPMIFSGRPPLKETVIESDVWIGYGAVITAGVKIGQGSIIAAGAVVTKDIPGFEIHGGVPAKKIRDRFNSAEDVQKHIAMLNDSVMVGEYCGALGS